MKIKQSRHKSVINLEFPEDVVLLLTQKSFLAAEGAIFEFHENEGRLIISGTHDHLKLITLDFRCNKCGEQSTWPLCNTCMGKTA